MTATATYNSAASKWSAKLRSLGYDRAYREFLHPHARPRGPVLDIGTGSGLFALAWVAVGGSRDLTLLDASPRMLDEAAAEMGAADLTCRLVLSDIDSFTPAERFDTILAAHVLEHCSDPQATMRRFAGWLRPGGQLLLAVSRPHWCNVLIWLRFRHRWFAADEIQRLGCQAGLQHLNTHRFVAGPPRHTSLGYVFVASATDGADHSGVAQA